MRLLGRAVAWAAIVLSALGLCSGQTATVTQSAPGGAIEIEPQRAGIGLRYNGTTVAVRAEAPAGYEAAVRLVARPGRLELKRLGKKGGIIWMGVGEVAFENVPAVYQVLTSAPLNEIGSPESLAEWKLGYDKLVPDGASGAALRPELVGLKESEGLFALRQGDLTRGAPGQQRPSLARVSEAKEPAAVPAAPVYFQGSFVLPARAPAGDYTVDLIGFKDRHAVHLASATLHLEPVGVVMALKRLAIEHGLAYGVAACMIAIIVGLLTGLLFRPKADESH